MEQRNWLESRRRLGFCVVRIVFHPKEEIHLLNEALCLCSENKALSSEEAFKKADQIEPIGEILKAKLASPIGD